jgi:hypothetical protein
MQTTIRAGESLSGVVDLTSGTPALLMTPEAWDPANASFQVSPDGTTFADLADANGN